MRARHVRDDRDRGSAEGDALDARAELVEHRVHQLGVKGVAHAQPRELAPAVKRAFPLRQSVRVAGDDHRLGTVHRGHRQATVKPGQALQHHLLRAHHRRHRTAIRQRAHQPPARGHQETCVIEREHPRHMRRGNLADRMAHQEVGLQTETREQPVQRHLEREHPRLGELRPVQQQRLVRVLRREQAAPSTTGQGDRPGPRRPRPAPPRTRGTRDRARHPCPPTASPDRRTETRSRPRPWRRRRTGPRPARRARSASRPPRRPLAPAPRRPRGGRVARDPARARAAISGSSTQGSARTNASRPAACARQASSLEADTRNGRNRARGPRNASRRRSLSPRRAFSKRGAAPRAAPPPGSRARSCPRPRTRRRPRVAACRWPPTATCSLSSRTSPSDQSTCGEGCSACSVRGSTSWRIAWIILMTPPTPAAACV